MLEGNIVKSVVLSDEKTGKTVLMGVAKYFDNQVNFKVPYEWESLDVGWFCKELKEVLARDLDIQVKQMDIGEASLLNKMREYHEWNKQ